MWRYYNFSHSQAPAKGNFLVRRSHLVAGIRHPHEGAERRQRAAAGEGGGDIRAEGGTEQHQGECDHSIINLGWEL